MAAHSAQAAVASLLGEVRPVTVTLIGDCPEIDWGSLSADDAPATEITRLDPETAAETLRRMPAQDLVMVGKTLEALEQRRGEQLLAGLRDLHARRVLLRLQRAGRWRHADVMAFGFTRLADLPGEPPVSYYGFDLYSYKVTPDWLNAKYWANPELFDKYRW